VTSLFLAPIATAAMVLAGVDAGAEVPPDDAGAEPIAVRVDAAPGCPGERDFFDQIHARTRRVRRAAAGERARTIRVSIESGARSVGRLELDDGSGATASRVVSAASCAQVVEALAFVAALWIDPAARRPEAQAGDAARDDAEAAPVNAGDAADVDGSAPAASEAAIVAAAEDAGTPAAPRAERPVSATPSPRPFRFGAGAGFDAEGLAAPGPLFGLRVFVDVAAERDALIAPAARLSFARHASDDLTVPGASARFTWWVARLDGCPIAFRVSDVVALRPCATLEAGALHAEGIDALAPQSRTRPWLAPGALARVEWSAAAWLVLGGEAGVIAPLLRENFVFLPDSRPGGAVYTPPVVAAHAAIAAEVPFP